MNGKELRKIRQMLRLFQTEIAKYLGVDNETVCRWEKTDRELTKLQSEAITSLSQDPDRVSQIRNGRRRRRASRRQTAASSGDPRPTRRSGWASASKMSPSCSL